MEKARRFERCIYCFAPKTNDGPCPVCGYDDGLCSQPGWMLLPGTLLKGRYIVGRSLQSTENQLAYLGWDLAFDCRVEIVEYFPQEMVRRDVTHADCVVCIPGKEAAFEAGKQAFFERAKLFYHCVIRVETLIMDFFVRNETCYHVRRRNEQRQEIEQNQPKAPITRKP